MITKKKELILKGIPASPGIAIGKAFLFGREQYVIPRRSIREDQIQGEIKRFKDSLVQTKTEINEIKKKISEEMGDQHGQIFSAHLLVIDDSMLIEEVIARLKKDKPVLDYLNEDLAQNRRRIQILKLACLLHDIGKPQAKAKKGKKKP